MSNPVIIAELTRIAEEHGGLLRPADVVASAKPKSSPLHSRFEWDDSEAAQQYRLWQARQLISVTVEYVGPRENEKLTRVFVSLTPDREDSGYRNIKTVMADSELRQQLLDDALDELRRFERKYADLKELSEVLTAIRKVKASARSKMESATV